MKVLETLRAIEKSNRGGTYYEKGSFLEGIILGIMLGIPVSVFHLVNKPTGIMLLVATSVLMVFFSPNNFRGLRRYLSSGIDVPGGSIRYSTWLFSLLYFVIVGGTVALVMQLFKTFFL